MNVLKEMVVPAPLVDESLQEGASDTFGKPKILQDLKASTAEAVSTVEMRFEQPLSVGELFDSEILRGIRNVFLSSPDGQDQVSKRCVMCIIYYVLCNVYV